MIPVYQKFAGARPDRDLDDAVLPSHSAADLRFENRRGVASLCAAAAALPLSAGRANSARAGAGVYARTVLASMPAGLWPSEGSVSDEALGIAADTGFRWAATDNGVLSRTLGRAAGSDETYRPYVWRRDGHEIAMVFRDHYLSDLIGFVYSRVGWADAAARLPRSHPRQLPRHPGRRPRRSRPHHPRRRERVGVLRAQRAAFPERAVPGHPGGPANRGAHHDRGAEARRAAAAERHFSRFVDRSELRRLDRRRRR